jgi:hypothetical protein
MLADQQIRFGVVDGILLCSGYRNLQGGENKNTCIMKMCLNDCTLKMAT